MRPRLKILITNDDGIDAPGLRYLWEILSAVSDLSIVAPASEKSGASLAITLQDPLHIYATPWDRGTKAWKVTGTPADCVRMALSVLLKEKPDLIVSGINRGSNSGRNVLYSGTIGGVIEGVLRDVPGIAFSSADYENPDYRIGSHLIYPLISHIIEYPLPRGTFLNVNFPESQLQGLKMARQGLGLWVEQPEERTHPYGHSYYWQGGKWLDHPEEEESDVHLLRQGFATAVPIHVNELTDLKLYHERKHQFEQLFIQ